MQGQKISPEEQAKIDAILAREAARSAPAPSVPADEQAKIDAILKRDKERAAASVTLGEKIAQIPGSAARGFMETFGSTAFGLAQMGTELQTRLAKADPEEALSLRARTGMGPNEFRASMTKAGQETVTGLGNVIPSDPRLEGSLWQTGPEAFGSAGFYAASAAAAGPATAMEAMAAAGAMGTVGQFTSGYYDALGETNDLDIAFEAALKNAPIGLLEGVPIGGQVARVLGRVNKAAGGGLVKLLVRAASEGGEEAAQELVASGWQDLVAKHIMAYDEDRKILEGALTTDALPGFVVGAVLGAASTGVEQKRAAGEQPKAQAQTEAQQAAEAWTAPVETPEPKPIEEVGGPQPIEVVGAEPGTPWQQAAQGQAGIPAAQTPTMPQEAPAPEPQELKHRDKEILGLVREKWSGLPYEVARAVSANVSGVVVGAPTRLDDVITGEQRSPDEFRTNAKQVYDSFSDVREAIREKYGSTVRLWRAQGSGEHGQLADYALKAGHRKVVLNYATKEEASKYLTEGRELVSRDVPVEDIVAVQYPTERGLYEEFIVLHPDATEADRRNLGILTSQEPAGSPQTPSLASEVTPASEAILEAPVQSGEARTQEAPAEDPEARLARLKATPPAQRSDAEIAWANSYTRRKALDKQAAEAAAKAEQDKDYNAFLGRFDPKGKARADAALGVSMQQGGMPKTRRQIVEESVSSWALVREHPKYGRILEKPDGSFVEQAKLTKAGMDYAEHLIAKRDDPNAATPPVVEPPTAPTEVVEPESPIPLPSEAAQVPQSETQTAPKAPEVDPTDTVGIANRKMQETSAKYGLEPADDTDPENFVGWFDEAKAIYDNEPQKAAALVTELEDSPRAPTAVEDLVLGLEVRARVNALDEAIKRYNADSTEENRKAWEVAAERYESIKDTVRAAGTASGRSLVARKALIGAEFTYEGMLGRRMAAEGGESALLREEGGAEKVNAIREEVKRQYDEIKEAEKNLAVATVTAEKDAQIAAITEQVESLRSKVREQEAAKPKKEPSKAPSRQREIQRSKARIDELVKELAVIGRRANVGAPLDPKALKIVFDIAVEAVRVGAMTFQEWTSTIKAHIDAADAELQKVWNDAGKSVRAERVADFKGKVESGKGRTSLRNTLIEIEESIIRDNMEMPSEKVVDEVYATVKDAIPGWSRDQLAQVLSGYGDWRRLTDDLVKRRRMQLNSEVQTQQKLLDVAKGLFPKPSGQERMPPTDEQRRLTKKLHEEMKRAGLKPEGEYSLKSALQTAKTRTENLIADLKFALEQRKRIVEERRLLVPDAELAALEARLEEVRKEYNEFFAAEIRSEKLDREIASVEKQLAAGGKTEAKPQFQGPPSSPEVAAKEKLLMERRAELVKLKEADEARAAKMLSDSLQRSILRMEQMLREDGKRPKAAKARPTSPLIRARESELKALKAELEALPSTQKSKEERLIAASIARKEAAIERLERNTIMQDLTGEHIEMKKRERRAPSKDEVRWAAKQEEALNRNLKSSADIAWKKAGKGKKALVALSETPAILRSLRTAFDFSAVLVQAGAPTLAHPLRAIRTWIPNMVKAAMSEEFYQQLDAGIRLHPMFEQSQRDGLEIGEIDGKMSKREEMFAANILQKLPGIAGRGVRASSRAYLAYINPVRMDSYASIYRGKPGLVTEAEGKEIAKFVNVFTGRGDLATLDEAFDKAKRITNLGQQRKSRFFSRIADGSAWVLWAPRLYLSRLQMLMSPLYYAKSSEGKTAFIRKTVAKEMARWLAAEASVYMLVHLYKEMSDDDEIEVETDPRSSDFGKYRVGETRIDPWGGLAQFAVLLSRMATGETKTLSGEVVPIRGSEARYGNTGYDVATRFARGKFNPFASLVTDYLLAGQNVIGESRELPKSVGDTPRFAGEVLGNYFAPMLPLAIYQNLRDQGFSKGAAFSILSAFGTSIQNYER